MRICKRQEINFCKFLKKNLAITFYDCTFAKDNKRFLCLFVKFVLYRGPVLCEKHRILFLFLPNRKCPLCHPLCPHYPLYPHYRVRRRGYNEKSTSENPKCFLKWEQRESNPRPSACKADALNQLSYAPKRFFNLAPEPGLEPGTL